MAAPSSTPEPSNEPLENQSEQELSSDDLDTVSGGVHGSDGCIENPLDDILEDLNPPQI